MSYGHGLRRDDKAPSIKVTDVEGNRWFDAMEDDLTKSTMKALSAVQSIRYSMHHITVFLNFMVTCDWKTPKNRWWKDCSELILLLEELLAFFYPIQVIRTTSLICRYLDRLDNQSF